MDNSGLIYKLWLNIQCQNNPERVFKCLDGGVSAEEVYNSKVLYRRLYSGRRLPERFTISHSLKKAYMIAEECEKTGIKMVQLGDREYPKRLSEMYMPPQVLFVKGELPDIDGLVAINIVGSRECSEYSEKFAQKLAYDLAASGILIVSGMAKGIDGFAHSGALMAGQRTVAVLAGGVDIIYPKKNAELYNEIIQNGAVISEMPPGEVGKGRFYKYRNRIMVGLCCGSVIIAGRENSGTSMTANWTADSNRDLFAVPGKPNDEGSELPNKLIKSNAKLVTSAEDVIEEYIGIYSNEIENGMKLLRPVSPAERRAYKIMPAPSDRRDGETKTGESAGNSGNKIKKDKNKEYSRRIREGLVRQKPNLEMFDEKQRIILEYLYNNNGAAHIDDISNDCGIEMSELNFLILQLMMAGAVKEHAGDNYSISI